MQYQSYIVQKKKIKKLWNLVERQEQFVSTEQQLQDYLKDNGLNDSIITILETDFESIQLPKPGQFPLTVGSRTTKENTEVGLRFNYQVQIDEIELPEILLPFINFRIVFKSIPETQIFPLHFWNFFLGTINEVVKVAGTEIYNGIQSSQFTRYQQEDIDSGRVNENSLKKVFFAEETSGDSGFVNRLLVRFDEVPGIGDCDGETSRKEILIDYNNSELHQIQQMSTTGFAGIGTLTEFIFTEASGGGCNEETNTLVDKGAVALNWADADDITLTLEASNGFPAGSINVTPDVVTDSGFWLYFGSDKFPPRVGFTSVGGDDTLVNTPEIFGQPVDVGTITATPTTLDTETSNLDPGLGGEFVLFELNEGGSGGTKRYRIHVGGEAVAISQTPDFSDTIFEDTKINTFTFSGGQYNESLSGDFSKSRFKFPSQDVQFKLILTLKNPFYYRTQTNFNRNDL